MFDVLRRAEFLANIHGEVSEARECFRRRQMSLFRRVSDGKPEGYPVEIADILIRVFDMAGYMGLDLDEAVKGRSYRHCGKVA